MAWTQADLDKLDAAIAGGAALQSIQFADQTFTFRTLKEMLELRAVMTASLSTADGSSTAYRLGATSKGV
jgi:hypothetical protein